MDASHPLQHAWRSFWVLRKQRDEPAWARLLISTGLGIGIALAMMAAAGLWSGQAAQLAWWRASLGGNLLLSLSIAYTCQALFRGLELALPARLVERIAAAADWRAAVFYAGVGIAGSVLGGALALTLVHGVFKVDAWSALATQPQAVLRFTLVCAVITAINWVWWKLHLKQQTLRHQATEAQLMLLQAQIEPHFLFNTLANVQSLIERDPPRASQLLDALTDHLRASLGALRQSTTTLDAELTRAERYLQLLQIRMGARLRFCIEAGAEARAAVLPPLLLQPLVENAVHHGLEPQVDGGSVCITASVADGRLAIRVDDDGRGLTAPPRPGRRGNGMALANVRARLRTRHGERAWLDLAAQPQGTRATLSLPYTTTP